MKHYYRNAFNVVPPNQASAQAAGWSQMSEAQSAFHRQGEAGKQNTKWIDGSGRCEAIYDGQGELVTDRTNGGTYNYAPPDQWIQHTLQDVIPYLIWGNGPIVVDPGSL